ncbi:Ail/Lom family outer membrane beta-barrel protein [Yersinia kristensenii]|uniref:Ail/Lom family outer membrane beta-barrel protein n=1 Tax=Yersinia kristensenii TaxID=28152 RepID=UPI0011A006BA|nr:Ail/Lom family outer membrane beta-barrel protein [Yersinia kristensenii]
MKKTLLVSSLIACFSIMSVNVYAIGESSISLGYAQSHVKANGHSLDKDHKGINVKYRYEVNNDWGMISSFTYTDLDHDYYQGNTKIGEGDSRYYSLTTGPIFRINEYVSLYGLMGVAHGKVKFPTPDESVSTSKTSMTAGAGIQFNPYPNVVFDASYEYSKLNDVKVGTWILGAGYRF